MGAHGLPHRVRFTLLSVTKMEDPKLLINIFYFVVFSATMAAVLEATKKSLPEVFEKPVVKLRILPVLPLIVGAILGPFVLPTMDEGHSPLLYACLGALAGSLSASCYKIFTNTLKARTSTRIKRLEDDSSR